MELILISNTKLKIMLNENDMRTYRINSETDCAEPATRRAIRSLLECAREQIGFNTEGSEIFVQLYTSKRGGCELFVTKSEMNEPSNSVSEEVSSPIPSESIAADKWAKRASRLPEKPAKNQIPHPTPIKKEEKRMESPSRPNGRIAFSFPDMTALLSVCRILKSSQILPDSRAFADDYGNCYLLLTNTGLSAYARLDKLTFILEYGKRENPDCLTSYINEHGKEICSSHAIETLGEF